MNTSTDQKPVGLDLCLRRFSANRNHVVEIKGGASRLNLLSELIEKAGISSKDLGRYRAASSALSAEVAKELANSVANRNAMKFLEGSAHMSSYVLHQTDWRSLPVQVANKFEVPLYTLSGPSPLPPPVSFKLDPDDFYRDMIGHGEGVGDGIVWPWDSDTETRGGGGTLVFAFAFFPALTTLFNFSSGVICGGMYYLLANDEACNEKAAGCRVSAALQVTQKLSTPVPLPGGSSSSLVAANTDVTLFERTGENICESGEAQGADVLELNNLLLWQGHRVDITVEISVHAWAHGNGSVADLNFTRPTGAIACSGLWVK